MASWRCWANGPLQRPQEQRGCVCPRKRCSPAGPCLQSAAPGAEELMPTLFAFQGILLLNSFQAGLVGSVPICVEAPGVRPTARSCLKGAQFGPCRAASWHAVSGKRKEACLVCPWCAP